MPLLRFWFLLSLLACLLCGLAGRAQHSVQLTFLPVYDGKPLELAEGLAGGDTVRVSLLRFYISRLQLLNNDGPVWTDPQTAHLLDADVPGSLVLSLPGATPYNAVRFLLGIDSSTNAAGVAGGDLDPVKGMYWAWQSGYINFKLEGTSARCNTRKHAFQFHLGGFRQGEGCAQWVTLPLRAVTSPVIVVDVAAFLDGLALETRSQVMSPGPEAASLSQKAAATFRAVSMP